MRQSITLIHTADVHLGASFPYLGTRGKDHRRRVAESFERLVDEALARRVDLFLVAGDLFHTKAPGRSTVESAIGALRRLGEAGITVALAPGTHDHDGPGSIWRLAPFEERIPGIQLLAGEGVVERSLPALGLTLVARPNQSNASPESPLEGVSAVGRQGLVVGVAHGSMALGERIGEGDFPITREDIASSGLNYLALGHWHKPTDCSQGGVTAWYSGSPEVLYPKDSGAGSALLVTIEEGETKVEPVDVGRCRAESLTLSVEDYPEASSLEASILDMADPELLLEVKLTGLRPLGSCLTPEGLEDLEAGLVPRFYFFRIRDEAHSRLDTEALSRHPEPTVAGRFVRILAERLDEAESDEDKRVIEEALQVGLALLEGREEVLG